MCLDCINELMDILVAHSNIFVGENILEESENLNNFDQVKGGIGSTIGKTGVEIRPEPWINCVPSLHISSATACTRLHPNSGGANG